jgi:hypothetical protein
MSREFQDSTRYKGPHNAVATTWLVSFEQIRKSDSTAANLLSFISCIEPKAIPRSILPGQEAREQIVHAIRTLCVYTFLVGRGDSDTFDINSLVYMATRVWVKKQGLVVQTIKEATRHLVEKFPSDDYMNRNLQRAYLPHAIGVLRRQQGDEVEESSSLSIRVGQCLQTDRRIREAVRCLEVAYKRNVAYLPEDHRSRLASQYQLASAYQADGQIRKAVEQLELEQSF